MITTIEKEQLAQHYFEKCFKSYGYNICGISDFYDDVLMGDFYHDKQDKQLLNFKELKAFHIFKPIEESTKIKLINLTKNCFNQMGYNVKEIIWDLNN